MVFISGPITVFTKETGKITKYLAMVSTLGMTGEPIKDIGKIIICMGKEYTNGLMAEFMKVNILMIRNMDMEFIPTRMADLTKEIGKTENNTEKEYL